VIRRLYLIALFVMAAALTMTPATPEATYAATTSAPAYAATDGIGLADVPLSLHRRAAQLLEEMRSNPSAPGWERAQLVPLVTPLYRPDIEEVAYYEFLVAPSTGEDEKLGFIIVSAGEHDFPIAHWNYTGESPTQELARKARENGQEAVKFYKLDALSYAAEDAQGKLVGNVGGELVKTTGLDPASLDQAAGVSEAIWTPDQQGGGAMKFSGPEPPKSLKVSGWESWAELQTSYRSSYQMQLDTLRRQAHAEWETDQLAEQQGEGLYQGQIYTLAMLFPDAEYTLSGEGAKSVQADLLARDGLPPALQITVLQAAAKAALPLDVSITYPNGLQETVKFAIVPATMHQLGNWSPWYEYWAGSSGDQRWYNQMSAGSWPNTSECYSGCGATAWAMLFGWADYQAAIGNPTWINQWGIYRYNGGYGTNAVAPSYMDSGVSNMTWEIRNRIGTFCSFGLGATFPWEMWKSSGYLVNRSPLGVATRYNGVGVAEDQLRDYAVASIRDRHTPAIIGTGWLNHYPLAYGYHWRSRTVQRCIGWWCWNETEYQREFYVNQGWGGSAGWVPASTWFDGEIYP
jgi:hypothetical protein